MKTFNRVIGFILGAAVMFALTRPVDLDDDAISYLLQEYCEEKSDNLTIGSSVAKFTHKLRRTQIIILRCAVDVYKKGGEGVLIPQDGGSKFVPYCEAEPVAKFL